MKKVANKEPPETEYGPNEDAEYLNIVWGVLRRPVQCQDCQTFTRTPCYIAELNLGPFCGECNGIRRGWIPPR